MEPNGRPPPERPKVHPVVMAAVVVLVAVISVVLEVRERRERAERRQELDRMVEQLEDCFADEECFSRLRERLR